MPYHVNRHNSCCLRITQMNLESPVALSRNAFMNELANNVRTGLGKYTAAYGLNVSQAEVDAWEQTNRACANDAVSLSHSLYIS